MKQKTKAELAAENERLSQSERALQEYFLAMVRKAPVKVIEVKAYGWRLYCTALHRLCGGVVWIEYRDSTPDHRVHGPSWHEPPVYISTLAAKWAQETDYELRDASLALRELMQRSCDESEAMRFFLRAVCARKNG